MVSTTREPQNSPTSLVMKGSEAGTDDHWVFTTTAKFHDLETWSSAWLCWEVMEVLRQATTTSRLKCVCNSQRAASAFERANILTSPWITLSSCLALGCFLYRLHPLWNIHHETFNKARQMGLHNLGLLPLQSSGWTKLSFSLPCPQPPHVFLLQN